MKANSYVLIILYISQLIWMGVVIWKSQLTSNTATKMVIGWHQQILLQQINQKKTINFLKRIPLLKIWGEIVKQWRERAIRWMRLRMKLKEIELCLISLVLNLVGVLQIKSVIWFMNAKKDLDFLYLMVVALQGKSRKQGKIGKKEKRENGNKKIERRKQTRSPTTSHGFPIQWHGNLLPKMRPKHVCED